MKRAFILFALIFISVQSFAQLKLVQAKNGKYGFVNLLGDTVVPAVYDYAENFSEGLALVKKLKGYKLIDTLGHLWSLDKFGKIPGLRYDWGVYHSGMPILVPIWECAYIDQTGKIALKVPYINAESFHNNVAKVYNGDKYAFINRFGARVTDWKEAPDEYRAVLYKGFYGYVNKNGRLVIDYQYRKAYDFNNGIAIASPDLTRWAVINKHGKYISDFYDKIKKFENGVAIVQKGEYYGFIGKDGKLRSGWFEQVQKMDTGLYRVEHNGKYALVKDGYQVTKWYDDIERYNDRFWLAKNGNLYAFLNNLGAYVAGWYNKLWTLPEYPDIVFVELNKKYGFYNLTNYYISPLFDTLIFSSGIALVRKNGKYGYLSSTGKKITNLIYDHATPFVGAVATVEKDSQVAYINMEGKPIMNWIDKNIIVKSPPPGLFVVKVGDKYGYQTLNGRRVIPAEYDQAEPFSDGVALVKMYPKWLYIDTTGKLLPIKGNKNNPALRLDWGYRHTLKPIMIKAWDYLAYINPEGKVVLKLPVQYTDAGSFVNGRAKVYKGDLYNYIDKKGNLLYQWQELPDDYHVALRDGKFGFIDKNNHIVIPPKFDYAYDFHNGLAKVEINGKWGYINRKGQLVTQLFDKISDFNDQGLAIAQNNGKYALVSRSGKVISKWYDKIYQFHDGLARVKLDGKYAFVNTKGAQITGWFDDAGDFAYGFARVKLNGKWGFINAEGKLVIKPQFDWATDFIGGMAKVEKDGKFALIGTKGQLITDWYDRIFFFSEERAVVMKNGKWGYIDVNGRLVIPMIYDRAFAFSDGKAMVIKGDSIFIIDKDGEILSKKPLHPGS